MPIQTKAGVIEWLKRAIASFDADPPDTPFQCGYLAAVEELLNELGVQWRDPDAN